MNPKVKEPKNQGVCDGGENARGTAGPAGCLGKPVIMPRGSSKKVRRGRTKPRRNLQQGESQEGACLPGIIGFRQLESK